MLLIFIMLSLSPQKSVLAICLSVRSNFVLTILWDILVSSTSFFFWDSQWKKTCWRNKDTTWQHEHSDKQNCSFFQLWDFCFYEFGLTVSCLVISYPHEPGVHRQTLKYFRDRCQWILIFTDTYLVFFLVVQYPITTVTVSSIYILRERCFEHGYIYHD